MLRFRLSLSCFSWLVLWSLPYEPAINATLETNGGVFPAPLDSIGGGQSAAQLWEAGLGVLERPLERRVALVTGAARGLGEQMAKALAQAGASVAFADIDAEGASAAAGRLGGRTGPTLAIACDVTQRFDCEAAVARTLEAFGRLDVLVNNAGLGPRHVEAAPATRSAKFWEADPDAWRDVIDANIKGTFLMARTCAPLMIAQGWGRIVNITTSLATMQRVGNSPYGVSKAAIETQTLIWAKDLAGTGVTCNSLIPGGAADTAFVSPQTRAALTAPGGRGLIDPAIMAAPIVWLASDQSDGVTGARFVARLWDASLPESVAAEGAREAPILRSST